MAKRIEKGFIDRLINKTILGKRSLGHAVKYNYNGVTNYAHDRFTDILYFPRNKLDKLIGNIYEACMPGFQYFIWNEHVRWARYNGYTMTEKLYHSWRSAPNIQLHAMAQMIHPWGYLESQRRDQFFRRITTLLPGIECPDWAQEYKRVSDYDLNSAIIPFEAYRNVIRESTPAPHILPPSYTAIHHIFNQRFNFGYSAQRLFFNEELRGDYYKNGILNKSDKEQINGWYADSQSQSQRDRIKSLKPEELLEFQKNKERWDKNFTDFYPEVYVKKYNPILHKYDEAYFERNINDIRVSIFTSKWSDALSKGTFNETEIQDIHKFFLEENTEVFFTRVSHDAPYEPTPLYEKFVEALDFPDFYEIDRFTTYPPEKQFYDLLDKNWGISFDSVDAYRRSYLQLIKKSNADSKVNSLVLEEVYNPLFRQALSKKYGYTLSQTESFTLKALENKEAIEELQNIARACSENTILTSGESIKRMVDSQVRKVVKSFVFSF